MDPADPERAPMPERIVPMLATLSKLPREDDAHAYEVKWDGVRAIAYCRGGRVTLQSRNLRDVTAQYPEVGRMGGRLGGREAVLDGELVAFGDDGRPSFQRLQGRMHLKSESVIGRRAEHTPVTYMAFDLLYLAGRVLFDAPYTERRIALESLELAGPHWQTPSHHVGDGAALLESSPFAGRQPARGAIFVEPRFVAEVEFSEWTAAGTLRQPSYKGLRDDKDALEVVR